MKSPLEYFYHWEASFPNKPFLRQPFGKDWKVYTYKEAGNEARRIVTALRNLGLKKGDHIGIYSKNCCHWIIADLAIMMGGFVSVPFYASLNKEALNEVIIKGDLKAIFVGKLDEWGDRAEAVPENVKVIRFPHYKDNAQVTQGFDWSDLIRESEPAQNLPAPSLDDLWTILFTSGTTGSPKGVMHTFMSPAVIFEDEMKYGTLGMKFLKEHTYFSFLPLNHVAERVAVEMNCLMMGGTISFAETFDSFIRNLQDTQPAFFFAVPRIWTKFQSGVFEKIPEKKLNTILSIPLLGEFFRKKLLKALGLKNAAITLTGAAITPAHLKDWYRKLGINLREVYGMTEACGGVTVTHYGEQSSTNVGKPLPGSQLKVDTETGEIIFKVSSMMSGYYKEPESTAQVLRDGWMHSGDRGTLDAGGSLHVLGRVKDVFKTSKGVFVVPNPIEEDLSAHELVEQVCVVGLGIPQPLALVNLANTFVNESQEQVESSLRELLEYANSRRNSHERLKAIVICRETWSGNNNILTPTLKVRRGKIDEVYGSSYHQWYDSGKSIIWVN
jgi:long-subunit acyl-CoA synthetase (AMP-forming)